MVATGLVAVGAANAGTAPTGSVGTGPLPTDSVTPSQPSTSPFAPTAPTDLTVTSLLSHSLTLSWTASTPGCCPITEYGITMARPFTDVIGGTRVANVATATVPVYPNDQYTISVHAIDSSGQSSPSSNLITLVAPANDTGDMSAPTTPGNLTFTDATGPTLTWSASTDDVGVTGYNVYHFDGWYSSKLVGTVTGTTFAVPPWTGPPPPGVLHQYYVRAFDAAGNLSIATNAVNGHPAIPTPSPSTAPPSPSPSPSPACTVTYTNVSQWPGGFVARLKAVNSGSAPIRGWKLGFTFGGDQRITAAWDATFNQSGAAATLRNTHGNAVIPAHGSVSMEIRGTWHGSDAAPTAFLLNDVPCAAG
ncbi:hypothetical protein Raf01_67400 [Rugosimonospora africana]|uniref:Uncharacterized protein n=2 Tax=Rugosimonospora africana TaxID=556532 RepID=A0A8J3VUF1_9ACTN|nr:hypothetical protein Raf01_67400 [Rugosimonospora africana]